MNVLGERAVEADLLDPINAQHSGLKPPWAMRFQIQFSIGFDAPLDEMFDGEL